MTAERELMSVCLIDDDQVYTFGFKKLIELKEIHSRVISFGDGYEAINWLTDPLNEADLPDVIFLDVNMPGMDGWEFMGKFAEIKSRLNKKIAIYMLSSSIDLNDIYRAKNMTDIEDYIFKPLNEYQIIEILRHARQAIDERISKDGNL
jgi:YesN/AraC family two-component response regulator